MALRAVHNTNTEKVGEIELSDKIFSIDVQTSILHEIVKMQLANRRSGTASTKTRGEISGSSSKPWRQKGTGRARAGHKRSPLWRGGGTTHGPKPRSYGYSLPKKVKRLGLCMALSARIKEDTLIILDDFLLEKIKTKEFIQIMKRFKLDNALIVTAEKNEILEKSSRNCQGFKVLPIIGLNVFDILLHKHLIFLQSSLINLEQRLLSIH